MAATSDDDDVLNAKESVEKTEGVKEAQAENLKAIRRYKAQAGGPEPIEGPKCPKQWLNSNSSNNFSNSNFNSSLC